MTTPFPFVAAATLTAAQMNAITTLPINDQTASYVALVGDVGKRIVMNVATGNTVTINNSVFATGDSIFISAKGAGSTTVTAGAGVTINTSSSLVLAQHGGGTLVALSASVFTFFSQQSATYGTATGGIGAPAATTVGGISYNLLTFTSDGTLTIVKSGLFDVLLFGGGGAAARHDGMTHGGGPAGGMVERTIFLDANQSVVVGAGAAAQLAEISSQGKPSSIGTGPNAISATGGLTFKMTNEISAGELGSLRGSSNGQTSGGTNNVQGNKGGNSTATTNSGAGGSMQAVGGNGSGTTGGAGAAGYDVNAFTGQGSLFKGSGGGGGGSVTGGAAGSSLGNAGTTSTGNTPAANTAAGGGGGNGNNATGAGASGVVFVRFKV